MAQNRLSRRRLLVGGLLLVASSSVAAARDGEGNRLFHEGKKLSRRPGREVLDYLDPWDPDDFDEQYDDEQDDDPSDDQLDDEQFYDPALLPPPESNIDYPVEAVDPSLVPDVYHRQVVRFNGYEQPGTVVVDPKSHFLYYVFRDGQAMRYGVGVGRSGFAWSGSAEIRMKRRWPRWVPPKEMVARDKRAMKWANGQPGGPDNPLGARALYLYADGKDTLYRIHGTNEPESIGKSVSSGCVRMLNQDIADLFDKVKIGTKVVVRAS